MTKPYEHIIALDFETAWGRQVKLGFSCQTNEEYIRDPRFKAWGLTYKYVGDADANPIWIRRNQIQEWVDGIDWTKTAIVAHNAQFDGTILSWLYGVKPAFIFDTLSMGRALRGVEVGNSLDKLASDYSLPGKLEGLSPSENILDELPFEVEQKLAEYCKHDTWLCEQLFLKMFPEFPTKELRLIDMTLRMYMFPHLQLDSEMLAKAIEEERETREGLLQRLGVTDGDLASNDRFAEILRGLGMEPPTKKSPANPDKQIFAFAKTDAIFQAMLNGDEEVIATLCEARLKVKSTTERTRAQRFLDIAARGSLPVPLSYYGANTGRWTAARGSAINMQNLKRGSFLRKAIMAPEGHVIGVADLSQIEPRVLAWLADYDELLNVFRAGGDPYATFGVQMFNIPGMTKESHSVERQSAKAALLGAGYQLGWASFAAQLLTGFLGAKPLRYTKEEAKKLGVNATSAQRFLSWDENLKTMEEIPHTCTDEELLIHCLAAQAIIDKYRLTAHPIVRLWELFTNLIEHSLYEGHEFVHKCLVFRKEEIVLPSGMSLKYPDLKPGKDPDHPKRVQWTYFDGKKRQKIYAGKITNNVTQGTARVVMTDGMLRIAKQYPVLGTVHDEALALMPEEDGAEGLKWMIQQMTVEPKYLPGIPLAADGGYHRRYGEAKK